MTLNELMAESDHEVYFCVVTPDGKEHVFISSDYHGAHPDVMPELKPLLGREFGDFDLVIRDDPERAGIANADKVPMVYVPLEKTGEEIERDRRECETMIQMQVDYAKIRSCVPDRYVLAFRVDDGSFIVFGADAFKCVGMNGMVNFTDKSVPRLHICDAEVGFRSLMENRRGIALAKKRKKSGGWCDWVVYRLVEKEEDLKGVKDCNEEVEED